MRIPKNEAARVLRGVDFGGSVAEIDTLLQDARVETSVFSDLLADRVDLIPGAKGSGKSALYRIFVLYLSEFLFEQGKVVIAHGVDSPGDNVFHIYREQFDRLSEEEFIQFWSIYFISLAQEQLIKNARYQETLRVAAAEVKAFRSACQSAGVPEIQASKRLPDVLEWALNLVRKYRPAFTYQDPSGAQLTLAFERDVEYEPPDASERASQLPLYVNHLKNSLEAVLNKIDLSLWLMVDRLDEIFQRRSQTETKALRALLRVSTMIGSTRIRVKIFLRDDIFEQITEGGFTALTHIAARQSDNLRWSQDQIVSLLTKRLFASAEVRELFSIDYERLQASSEYREACFYKVFPPTVNRGARQSNTIRWLYKHTMDGKDVVTPRDVIVLLTLARQSQLGQFDMDSTGFTESLINGASLRYGLEELSKRKRLDYLSAEFPHFWDDIKKLIGGKTEYSAEALSTLLGEPAELKINRLVGIGLLRKNRTSYQVPFLYRAGLELTQGKQK